MKISKGILVLRHLGLATAEEEEAIQEILAQEGNEELKGVEEFLRTGGWHGEEPEGCDGFVGSLYSEPLTPTHHPIAFLANDWIYALMNLNNVPRAQGPDEFKGDLDIVDIQAEAWMILLLTDANKMITRERQQTAAMLIAKKLIEICERYQKALTDDEHTRFLAFREKWAQ